MAHQPVTSLDFFQVNPCIGCQLDKFYKEIRMEVNLEPKQMSETVYLKVVCTWPVWQTEPFDVEKGFRSRYFDQVTLIDQF